MPFEKVDTQIDFPAQERAILDFWDRSQAFDKLRAQSLGKPKWSFLDGPITANNPMGVHHAWGRTYKDAYNRYFAMTGHELRYQNGFDCQGLWVEVEVEKALGLTSKRDIENLVAGDPFASIAKFVQECKDRVNHFARVQTNQSIRLGYWMDWDRTDADWAKGPDRRKSYFTMSNENNYTIWSFLKKCHERGLIYRGYDAMPWCPRCAVGLSQMEMHEGYQFVAHRSVFVKFPLRNQKSVAGVARPESSKGVAEPAAKENLLVWTTTPWTLTSNVAAAVNPQLTYLRVKHKDEIYYLAKGALTTQRLEEQFKKKEWIEGVPKLKTLEQIFKEKGGFEILGEVKGADLVGWTYDGPFDDLPAQRHPAGYPAHIADTVLKQDWGPAADARSSHRVIAWDAVGEVEGTGIVHIAPGCGKEDFALGKENRLVPVAPLDEFGHFLPGFGPLTGKSAVDHATTDWILANLQEKGILLAWERYPHSYPHCWRCKTELLFRLIDEWFINMKWRDEIMKICHDIRWVPEDGLKRELDWLKNMGDWMISKKRFWGLALPIWVDDKTGDFEVIGSEEELRARAVEGWDRFAGHSPHRPYIDLVKIRNPKTGNLMSRIPDVGNPWLDAGIVPYSTLRYNADRAYWEKWFPADFITESFPGQFRNWFYALLAMSTMMTDRAPFRVLLGHALVRDQKGEDMHKSKGNAIPFDGAADTGYELFCERNPKMKPEEQAARELPAGWLSLSEGPARIEKREFPALKAKYPPMSADVMRWMYCRQNPVVNINFGPTTAEEIRSKFVMKLWNTYAFFCNYAQIDNFDPSAPQVPVGNRPDIDRWILSDLNVLIQKARQAFESYDVMTFCLAAEKFVDDKLSNWYVRRNRRRFWKSEQGADKQAAYQTLCTVLTTLIKLCAPIVPFLAEAIYQNLERGQSVARTESSKGVQAGAAGAVSPSHPPPVSVHLCPYPQSDENLIDAELSADMEALLRIVSLGSAARNLVKIKVRQPLAELKIQPGSDADRRAVERFADQVCEELNLKKTTLHERGNGALLKYEIKPNMKSIGPKFGGRLKAVQAAIAAADPAAVAERAQAGLAVELAASDGPLTLEPSDVVVTPKTAEGWAGLADRGTQLLLDARITPALAQEGMAREVIRHVQNSRKDAGLQMEDRIVLHLGTEATSLAQAVQLHKAYIAAETLVVEWRGAPLGAGAFRAEAKVDGQKLVIELRKA
jgi:isoleucyl-tRNA synthetase